MGRSKVEYATDQITVYNYCPHGCIYCFWRIPLMRSRLQRIVPRPLEEAERYARMRKPRRIVVSFTTDPYPPEERRKGLTRRVLEILARAPQHTILILTKNPKLALRDIDIMHIHGNMWLGTTVTTLRNAHVLEPKAPPPQSRLGALREAHEEGIRTWLSIEPIIPPFTELAEIIERTHDYVDFYVLGALNYARQLGFPEPSVEEYFRVLKPALALLWRYRKEFMVKRELCRLLKKDLTELARR